MHIFLYELINKWTVKTAWDLRAWASHNQPKEQWLSLAQSACWWYGSLYWSITGPLRCVQDISFKDRDINGIGWQSYDKVLSNNLSYTIYYVKVLRLLIEVLQNRWYDESNFKHRILYILEFCYPEGSGVGCSLMICPQRHAKVTQQLLWHLEGSNHVFVLMQFCLICSYVTIETMYRSLMLHSLNLQTLYHMPHMPLLWFVAVADNLSWLHWNILPSQALKPNW